MGQTPRLQAQVQIRMDCLLGEGPRWDPWDASWVFVDVLPGLLHRVRPDAGEVTTAEVGQALGAANPTAGGGLVLALRDGIYLSPADASQPLLLAPVEIDVPSNRMNDAACDPQGRLWAGTMSFDAEPGAGTLYRIDPDGSVHPMIGGLTISNGMGWNLAGDRMYFIDSPTRRIDVLDFDSERGTVRNRRPLVELADTPGVPDGMTVDADGGLWVAIWGGAQVRRYDSEGMLTCIVEVPVPQPTSCAFGGPDGMDLFITSARLGLSDADLAAYPLSGSVFSCRPGYAGMPTRSFAAG